jgi:subtilisin family serine protease
MKNQDESLLFLIVKLIVYILILVCAEVFVFILLLENSNGQTNEDSDKTTKMKVVIIDTGIKKDKRIEPFLCKESYDATGTGIEDRNGHGTHIASIIAENLDTSKYCLYIVKFFDKEDVMKHYIKAIKHVESLKNVFVVNMSLGGPKSDKEEREILENELKKGIILNVAAGNEGLNLDTHCGSYPACYNFSSKNFHSVGNLSNVSKERWGSSNYGKVVKYWEVGAKVKTWAGTMTGTSQATAIHTRNMVKK